MRSLMSIFLLSLIADTASGHGGGLDSNGGHFNRKTGEYHCHREPCFSNREQVIEATVEAEKQGISFSTRYDRDEWRHWIDTDGDCQNTRAEILIQDSLEPVSFGSQDSCRVIRGRWLLPYTGGTVTNARQLDIDHIVPLKWAHGHGGDRWDTAKKTEFANDPENLLPVWSSANRSKGSKGPDQWMPTINRCEYAEPWQRIIEKYELLVIRPEKEALKLACE